MFQCSYGYVTMQLVTFIADHFVNNCPAVYISFQSILSSHSCGKIVSQYGMQLIHCIKEPIGEMLVVHKNLIYIALPCTVQSLIAK